MTAAEPTPLEAAAEAMHDQRCSGDGACDHGGRFEQLAALALTAGLAGDWLERVLGEHMYYVPDTEPYADETIPATRWQCAGCEADLCEYEVEPSDALAAHQAAAVRTAAGVGL